MGSTGLHASAILPIHNGANVWIDGGEGEWMEDFGQGHCADDYLRGWDGKGTESQLACNAVCMAEPDCTYAAWVAGQTCSRYKGRDCNLDSVDDRYTYAKR